MDSDESSTSLTISLWVHAVVVISITVSHRSPPNEVCKAHRPLGNSIAYNSAPLSLICTGHHLALSGRRVCFSLSSFRIMQLQPIPDDGRSRPTFEVARPSGIVPFTLSRSQQMASVLCNTAIDLVLGPLRSTSHVLFIVARIARRFAIRFPLSQQVFIFTLNSFLITRVHIGMR